MHYYAVQYQYATDAEALSAVRPEHRAFLATLVGKELIASGPYTDVPSPAALLIMQAASETDLAKVLDADPFWKANLIVDRSITGWDPVIGIFAS